MKKLFDGKKTAKLGTDKNPAVINVQTKKRRKEVESVFEEKGWKYSIEVDEETGECGGDHIVSTTLSKLCDVWKWVLTGGGWCGGCWNESA